jgi:hypothetical protein
MEAMDDHLELLADEYNGEEQRLENPVRTIGAIPGYDVAADPCWSVME